MRVLLTFVALISLVRTSTASCEQQARVAVGFMNDYTQYTSDLISRQTSLTTSEWLTRSKRLSPGFIARFNALEAEGRKKDAELGWGVDLIFDAQDSPDKGFDFFACKADGYVELQGRDWPAFHVVVKVVLRNGAYNVDGAGRVNIPTAYRAKR